jgi:hypothetical protein
MRGSWALGTLLDVACFYGKATWAADNLTITITKK